MWQRLTKHLGNNKVKFLPHTHTQNKIQLALILKSKTEQIEIKEENIDNFYITLTWRCLFLKWMKCLSYYIKFKKKISVCHKLL